MCLSISVTNLQACASTRTCVCARERGSSDCTTRKRKRTLRKCVSWYGNSESQEEGEKKSYKQFFYYAFIFYRTAYQMWILTLSVILDNDHHNYDKFATNNYVWSFAVCLGRCLQFRYQNITMLTTILTINYFKLKKKRAPPLPPPPFLFFFYCKKSCFF